MLQHRRRFAIALALSIVMHAAFFYYAPGRKPPDLRLAGSQVEQPMTVQIVQAEPAPAQQTAPAEAQPPPHPTPPPRPVPVPPLPAPRIVRRTPEATTPAPPTPPEPTPPPQPAIPEFDMAAMIEARRAQRRAAETAAARGPAQPTQDQLAQANIARNLQVDRGEGVGGVFQILRKGTRTAEFAFNGWRPDTERRWREVIEVDAGQGGDVERAIVKRMIALIRTHYTGDFRWESHQLGRVVVLSARPEDNDGLEDFLIREFFGTPMLNERR